MDLEILRINFDTYIHTHICSNLLKLYKEPVEENSIKLLVFYEVD
jgi:hypothetical protein